MARIIAVALAGLTVLVLGSAAVGEEPSGPPPCGKAAELELTGTIEAVASHAGWMGWDGVYATLKADGRNYEIHVAPASFLADLGLELAAGNRVTVKGCVARVNGAEAVMVREIRRENVVLNLRDSENRPVW